MDSLLDKKVNVISRNGTFLFRFNNGAFGSKWCGIWEKTTKFVDYFAFKMNEDFLSDENISDFKFYNSGFCSYDYTTRYGKITEEDICTDRSVFITVKPDFDCKMVFETGVNIRDRSENYVESKLYGLFQKDKKVQILLNNKGLMFTFDKGEFSKSEYYGIHIPGKYAKEKGFSKYFDDSQPQNKYVPGIITANLKKGEEFNLSFFTYPADDETIYRNSKNRKRYAVDISGIIKAAATAYGSSTAFDNSFLLDVIDAMYSYSNFNDSEIYAGFPYFNEFWLRDALLIAPSFLILNNPDFVKRILLHTINLIHDGKMPSTSSSELYPLDVPAIFLKDVSDYVAYTGDIDFFRSNYDNIMRIITYARSRVSNGLIHDKGRETWMDSKDREFSIEIQALWENALSAISGILRKIGQDYLGLLELSKTLRNNINLYEREGFLSDQLSRDINSCNQIFPLYLGSLSKNTANKVIENIKANMISEDGVFSMAKNDPTFSINGYHDGQIWPFISCFAAGGSYMYGDSNLGEKILNIVSKRNLGSQCSSRINEIIQPDGKPQGCPSQAWSMCCLPEIIDRCILGIRPDILNKTITIDKKNYAVKFKRHLRTPMGQIDLEFDGKKLKSNVNLEETADNFKILL